MSDPLALPLLPHLTNILGSRDRISSAASADKLQSGESDTPFLDKQYGHTWSFTPKPGSAVYGLTNNFKPSPVDHLASGRFLRVPFRGVPVFEFTSLDSVFAFAGMTYSMNPNIKLMWRGQTAEYFIKREEADSLRLFGEPQVAEPSLGPSASRSGLEFKSIFKSWSAILDAYIMEQSALLAETNPAMREKLATETERFRAGYDYRLWAFATAQHYGLPSVGLDVTSDLAVALLFSLYNFNIDRLTGRTTFSRVADHAEPILYALGAFENDLFDDAKLSPPWFQCARPKAQSAFFLATGWGLASNRAAERIFVAIRLRNHKNWELPKSVDSLLPSQADDRFLSFLLDARRRFEVIAKEAMLDRIYYSE